MITKGLVELRNMYRPFSLVSSISQAPQKPWGRNTLREEANM
jgi:hypothetical protein